MKGISPKSIKSSPWGRFRRGNASLVLSSRRRKEQKEPLRSEERNNINNKKETKDNEKQRFLENSDTIHHLDAHCSIDSYEHYELHGPRPHLHVKEMPPLFDSEGITSIASLFG